MEEELGVNGGDVQGVDQGRGSALLIGVHHLFLLVWNDDWDQSDFEIHMVDYEQIFVHIVDD